MRKIVEAFPRHGSERTHQVLTGPDAFGGWKVNFKRVHSGGSTVIGIGQFREINGITAM